jgi:membrane protein
MEVSVEHPASSRGELLSAIIDKMLADELFGRAAQIAYFLLLSLFPTLILVTLLISIWPFPSPADSIFDYLGRVLPPQAFLLVRDTLSEALELRPPGFLSLSVIVTIWTASSAIEAIIGGLNRAYNARESRGLVRERLFAIVLSIGLSFFIVIALTLIFFGGSISTRVARYYGVSEPFGLFWDIAHWIIAALFILLALDLIYYFAPNIKQNWYWVTPGAAVALILWLLVSVGLRFYVLYIGNYNVTYGALGGVMVLLLWLYFTSTAILLGGIVNAVLTEKGVMRKS